MKWVICDLDGTLCDICHRLPFIKRDKPDWEGFNNACMVDTPKVPILELLRTLHTGGWMVCLMTGRSEQCLPMTEQWLNSWKVPHDLLLMRPQGDLRSDHIIKEEMYRRNITCVMKYMRTQQVLLVLEDRDRVVEMWRSLGITCLQVQKGDY